jgi:uncharacterized membrane protein
VEPKVTQLLAALGFFKDWSNYLLVTTVAALGWVATKPILLGSTPLVLTIGCFCASIIFAIFTLALIPIVGEGVTAKTESFYEVSAKVKVIWLRDSELAFKLKWFCLPQHVLFLAGIIIFSIGTISGATCSHSRT